MIVLGHEMDPQAVGFVVDFDSGNQWLVGLACCWSDGNFRDEIYSEGDGYVSHEVFPGDRDRDRCDCGAFFPVRWPDNTPDGETRVL